MTTATSKGNFDAIGVSPAIARWLALGAIIGPVVFTLAWFILGFVSPGYTLFGTEIASYSPISQPISGLGMGSTAPYMNAAFILCGLLLIAGVIGIFQTITEISPLQRRVCTVLLALSGLGVAMDGIFNLESMLLHTLGFLLGIGSLVLSFLITGLVLRRIPRWRRFGSWLLLGSPLTLALLVTFFATFNPEAAGSNTGVSGLVQRILATEVYTWFVIMGWLAFRRS